ncbi:MAG: transcription-repair coupling factor [Verrucomicrobia bacterium]|nr:transcription-repair coupling factor [Verrucomicrobiota bacterium]MBS0645118.1 transcription-repair coupling factor [Verrucomicrobiota bacterium]
MDLVKTLLTHPKLLPFQQMIEEGESIVIEGLWEVPKALLIALAQKYTAQHVVVLTHSERLLTDFPFFGLQPLEYPAWETLPSEDIPPSPDRVGERYRVLHALAKDDSPKLLVCSLQAALQKILPKKKLKTLYLHLKAEESVSFSLLIQQLCEMGYQRKPIAADKGEFAVRGGILDLYPVDSPDPYRVEFEEDKIVSIRKYDPIAQTSVGKVEQILITPGQEYELLAQSEQLETIFDYLGPHTLVVFDQLMALEDKYTVLKSMLSKKVRSFLSLEELLIQLKHAQKVFFVEEELEKLSSVRRLDPSSRPYSTKAPPEPLTFESFGTEFAAKRWRDPFLTITEACQADSSEQLNAHDLVETLQKNQIPLTVLCQTPTEKESFQQRLPDATVMEGYLSSGLVLLEPALAILPTVELTGRVLIRRQKQRSHYHSHASEFMALSPGEAVVHMNSGIGRYLGIEKRSNHLGQLTEFMVIEYAEQAKLYVPMEQANLIAKYIGAGDSKPEFHALGSTKWQRSRERSEQAILGYAADLLELQAKRVAQGGFAYPESGDLVKQFEQEFPYQETDDQLLAISSVYQDMQTPIAMDRLVCGDVGYGKTEVAMRAAFKAVVDGGKQVAVLVPTTVLALQHFESFRDRMQSFPVRIGVISRFQKPKEIRLTLEQLRSGDLDIVVGTHRLVSQDVIFKDLGLVVIDEEQRFGVKSKEHLKKIKHEVDCLTLSATPIPRTLYLSLVGARQLSVINTPPEDRLPIQSMICQKSDEVIKNALLRELARDGQAYIIHNRVDTIFEFADHIRQLVPAARIAVGHGQMSSDELDAVFHAFKSARADILIATSIIENGIDIPNANTILIDQSDRFGLADLYQMRGRVGRWNRKAYCYFLVSNLTTIQETSRKRLTALVHASGQGGGMKIAMQDLEIRGAGNILGLDQSGHVQAIGFHFYCKLLKKAVHALSRKQKPLLYTDVKLEFPYDARLPEDYVNDVTLRMEMYQRLGDVNHDKEVDELLEELTDRFGPPPQPVQWLCALSKLRRFAQEHAFTLLRLTKVVLHAEQTHGKKEKVTQKILIRPSQDPQSLVKEVCTALSSNFILNQERSLSAQQQSLCPKIT